MHESAFDSVDFRQRVKAVARWSQIGLSSEQLLLMFAVTRLMATLARLDYPQSLVSKGVCSHGGPIAATT